MDSKPAGQPEHASLNQCQLIAVNRPRIGALDTPNLVEIRFLSNVIDARALIGPCSHVTSRWWLIWYSWHFGLSLHIHSFLHPRPAIATWRICGSHIFCQELFPTSCPQYQQAAGVLGRKSLRRWKHVFVSGRWLALSEQKWCIWPITSRIWVSVLSKNQSLKFGHMFGLFEANLSHSDMF